MKTCLAMQNRTNFFAGQLSYPKKIWFQHIRKNHVTSKMVDPENARQLLKALQNSGAKIPDICIILFGNRDQKTIDALHNFKRGSSSRRDICTAIYDKAPDLWNLTDSEEARRIILSFKTEDAADTYSNQLRKNYGASAGDLAEAGGVWAGTYIGYRQDPHTSRVIKTTLNVNSYSPLGKSVAYTHRRHDTDHYFVKGWIVPTVNTYSFFGQTYKMDGENEVLHGGAITIFVSKFTKHDKELWGGQKLTFKQGLMLISLPDETYSAFSTRVLFLKVEDHNKDADFTKPWISPQSFETAVKEIDSAMGNPSVGPKGSIARPLLSNEVLGPEDCLVSYINPVP